MYIDDGLYLLTCILMMVNIHANPYLIRLGFAYAGRSTIQNDRLLLNTSKFSLYIRLDRD